MKSKIIAIVFCIFFCSSVAQTNWIRAGYYMHSTDNEFPISAINSSLFTHLICGYADVDSTSYQLLVSPADAEIFSTFTNTVKQNNPSLTTLLSIGGSYANKSATSLMVSDFSYRKSFIDSSIKLARLYGFQGLDFDWHYPFSSSEVFNIGVLFQEWRAAIVLEAAASNQSQLLLTARVKYTPTLPSGARYPIESIQQHLNWVHVAAQVYIQPMFYNFTGAHAALYNPTSFVSTDFCLREWIIGGLSANKMVLSLPPFGYAWTLENPMENGIGAAAKGPAIRMPSGGVTYREIKNYIKQYGRDVPVKYNSTYVVNYWTKGTIWIGFDDVEAIKVKVSYANEKKLLGYHIWGVSNDVNWILAKTAAEVRMNYSSSSNVQKDNKGPLLVILLSATATFALLLGVFVIFYRCRRSLKLKGTVDSASKGSKYRRNDTSAAREFDSSAPNLITYNFHDIEAATDGFSIENKLGEGGYGPVYKGLLPIGQEVAVKKLSKTSAQGYEQFRNEVVLTAKLQHVNLLRILGFCTDREEHMLIYEYMPNKSLDYFLFDPIRRYTLDWRKRVLIIEGIVQGLLYLQEYSRLTIIHRDLKASNVLLDEHMKPKISDFGMARIFAQNELEANTGRVVGTYGYVPPEYVKRGIYSMKSDVYSFGVLLLQIISGKRVSILYGHEESLSLLDYAYGLWKDNKGMEFMDLSLDDTDFSCKLIKCLQIALLCVQENPSDRPSMLEVYFMLKNETLDIMSPKKPAFSKQDDENGETIATFNGTTISEVVGR